MEGSKKERLGRIMFVYLGGDYKKKLKNVFIPEDVAQTLANRLIIEMALLEIEKPSKRSKGNE